MDINIIDTERSRLDIQMHTNELYEIVRSIKAPANFLIFGLGNDSVFWYEVNKGGRTIFIEDNKEWFDKIHSQHSFLECYLVDYNTKLSEWREYIGHPENPTLGLPTNVLDVAWDIILVDGPGGYSINTPGRMKSIYLASILTRGGGDVFVHDAEREVERECCTKFLSEASLISVTDGRATLRHYKKGK
jgi:hypothetical protein